MVYLVLNTRGQGRILFALCLKYKIFFLNKDG